MKSLIKSKIICIISFLIPVGFGIAENNSSNEILGNYIRQGLKNSPIIKLSFDQWKSEDEKSAYFKGLPNPSISFGYFLESVETAAGPQEYKLSFMQKFPWFGKRKSAANAQSAKAEIKFQELENQRLNLMHSIRSEWYDYYYLMRVIDLTKQYFELIQNWDSIIRTKYVTSRVGHPDLIKTQIELIQLEDELLSLENQKSLLLESFRNLINDHTLLEIIVPDSLAVDVTQADKKYLFERIGDFNPELKMINAELLMNKSILKKAKLNRFPDIGLGIEYIGTGEKIGSDFSGIDPVVSKISLDIPLWFNKNKSQIKSANLAKNSIEHKLNVIQNKLRVKLEEVLYDLEESERQIQLYRNVLIPKGLESLGATEKAYRSDKIDFLSLVDSQQRLLTFEMKYEKALINYLKAKSKLSLLIGEKES